MRGLALFDERFFFFFLHTEVNFTNKNFYFLESQGFKDSVTEPIHFRTFSLTLNIAHKCYKCL